MKPLEERIEDRKKECEEAIRLEYLLEEAYQKFLPLFPANTNFEGSAYSNSTHLYAYMGLKELEDAVGIKSTMERITESLAGAKWSRDISETDVRYRISYEDGERDIHLTVYAKIPDGCRITRRLTGRKIKREHYVEMEEEEIEYLVDCSETEDVK
jgi:hypothetical protein